MKRLGFGFMRLPYTVKGDPGSINIEKVNAMVDEFMARGYNYFDTAWMYQNFKSEDAIKTCVVDRYPRESFTVATKLHSGFFESREDIENIFSEQLRKTGAGYFDYYLLHGLDEEMYEKHEKFDTFSWLLEKKAQGLVKHAGFSFHAGPELLRTILTKHPEMEFVQLQINYLDWENPAIGSRECYEVACEFGKPVIVMEPVKGGTLAKVPQEVADFLASKDPSRTPASWALRFPLSLENVMVVLSGMFKPEQMTENLDTADSAGPLSEDELQTLHEAVRIMNSLGGIPCTGCSYCTTGCPMNIPIPQYFALYNADIQEVKTKGWNPQEAYYGNLARTFGKASDCIACGQCEGICPQKLPIIENLKTVAEYFEGGSAYGYTEKK
ncbi:MAG: aldo/keto reductase [Firmicutes bacterium]|nr:aldo/keto reductase [Bacillota bacterium]